MPRDLKPREPHQLVTTLNRCVGWVKISPLPAKVREGVLSRLAECISLLAGVSNGSEEKEED